MYHNKYYYDYKTDFYYTGLKSVISINFTLTASVKVVA